MEKIVFCLHVVNIDISESFLTAEGLRTLRDVNGDLHEPTGR